MDDKPSNHSQSSKRKGFSFKSLFGKNRFKNLFPFSNLQLQIPNSTSRDSETSPTSVVLASGPNSVFDSPTAASKYRNTFSVLPDDSGDLFDDYLLTPNELGRGRYGIVRECINKFTGEVMACKSVDKSKIIPDGKGMEALILEIMLGLTLNGHPNIIQFNRIYEDSQSVHFVMEKCTGGDLFDVVTNNGRLTEKESARMLSKIGGAVAFMHSKGVVHRDIKPENILINNLHEMEPKLGDFGEAFVMKHGRYPFDLIGTPAYMAPEVILGFTYDFAVDVWSLGILLYIMLSGLLPYYGSSLDETFERILKYEPNLAASPWDTISEGAKHLVCRMLRRDPRERIRLQEVLADPWLLRFS